MKSLCFNNDDAVLAIMAGIGFVRCNKTKVLYLE